MKNSNRKKDAEIELMPIPFDDIMRRVLQVPPQPITPKKPKIRAKKKK